MTTLSGMPTHLVHYHEEQVYSNPLQHVSVSVLSYSLPWQCNLKTASNRCGMGAWGDLERLVPQEKANSLLYRCGKYVLND